MASGYIKLYRKLQENPLWQVKPFSKGQAWVDLLFMANHSPKTILLGNEIVELQRGQLHTSELKLAEKWGWSRKQVRAYLDLMENLKMGTTDRTTKGTTITIENYTLYQDSGTTEDTTKGTLKEQRRNNERTTKGTLTINEKNVKNVKNDKKEIYKELDALIEKFSENEELRSALKDFVKMRKTIKSPLTERAMNGILNKLTNLSADEQTQIAILEQSIISNWKTVYSLKGEQGNKGNGDWSFTDIDLGGR